MEDLSLHILDIAENSIAAGAHNIEIFVREDSVNDILKIEITDDGRGMNAEMLDKATEPFFTTRTTRRIGLGLSFLKEAAQAANGSLVIQSYPERGTKVSATFQLSNIDRKPLGNVTETILSLLASDSNINVVYRRERNDRRFVLDSRDLRDRLGDLPLNTIESLKRIREVLNQNEHTITNQV